MAEESTIKLVVEGAGSLAEGLAKASPALEGHRAKLLAMGWSEEMAGTFLAEVAEIVVRHTITVRQPDR
jgi:hypothetical protein